MNMADFLDNFGTEEKCFECFCNMRWEAKK